MFCSSNELERKMNEAGRLRIPFLFGVDFEVKEGFYIEYPQDQSNILFDINGISNSGIAEPHVPNYKFTHFPENSDAYEKRFSHVMHGLRRGDSYLANLTIKTPIETNLSLHDIFMHSHAMYRLLIPGKFVCFSPERFVKIENGKIFSNPMKGTINADIPNASEILLADFKETAEHNTIVDLIRNDLSRISSNVKVNRFRYLDMLRTSNGNILQASSEIEGTLPSDYLQRLGSLFFALLPAGSISGAPKEATLQLIREAEQQPRGFYTGVTGYFDGENIDSGVLIRFIEQENNKLYFRSGGGITINSECKKEYREAIQKVYLPFQSG